MQSEIDVLLDSVVKAVRFPCVCEEYEGDGLTKVIELETASSDGVHNRGIMNDPGGDVQCPCTKDDICMRGCAEKKEIQEHYIKRDVYRTRKDPLLRVRRHLLYRHYVVYHRFVIRPFRDQLGSEVFRRKPPFFKSRD